MRILLSKNSKEKVFKNLLKINNCNSYKHLSVKLKIPFRTLQKWMYDPKRYFPQKIIPNQLLNSLEILDKQEDNWGNILGGRITNSIIVKKYGKEEIKRRQINGGKRSIALMRIKNKEEPFNLDLKNKLFLEFYGALLGDGWLSKFNYRGKAISIIGFSGNAKKDREYLHYLQKNINLLFNRKAYLKEKPRYNAIEIIFTHKILLDNLNQELKFPIGLKSSLMIDKKIYDEGFSDVKYIIRGIFDTDGCLYFDKTPVGRPYPCISIVMKEPILIGQIKDILISQGFKVQHRKRNNGTEDIILKGTKQTNKWMKEIGSSNKRNLDKYALVAQPG